MIETVENLTPVPISFSGSIDEISPSDDLAPGDAVKFTNWRLSKDGKRIQKRAGLLQDVFTSFGEDIYGYSTYFNSSGQYCEIAVLEGKVSRRVANTAWSDIYDYPSGATISHVVKPLEINGKQYIITEKGSCVVLADGSVRQIGISAPTLLASATPYYSETAVPPMYDTMNYANQGAMDAVWTDNDSGTSASTLAIADPDADPGPNADARYMRLLQGSPSVTAHAKRTRSLSGTAVGHIYSVEICARFDTLPSAGLFEGLRIQIDNGSFIAKVCIGKDGAWLVPRNSNATRIITEEVPINKWIKWNISVDATDMKAVKFDLFMTYDGVIKSHGTQSYYPPESSGMQKMDLYTDYMGFTKTDVHIDYVRIDQVAVDAAKLTGLYRYAFSFIRTGDFGYESNPIKSSIGSVTFSGAGLNDMTVDEDSSYTGNASKNLMVKIKTAASPQDTLQWSEDGGESWKAEVKLQTKVYLGEGVTVNFGAITGHVATNYWTIPCNACSAVSTIQYIKLTSIPTSTDEQVTARKIYRTTADGSKFYYLTTIYDRNVTTEFLDNFADSTLGDEMLEDRDVLTEISTTIGKYSEYWDDRLWVADHSENVIYYSALRSGGGVPEEFDMVSRFVPVKRGVQGDAIMAMKAYKDALYVFKRNDIYVIQKTIYGYAAYHINSDLGCVADGCVDEVNDFLMFPSERGPEIYDGVKAYDPEFATKVSRTFLSSSASYYRYMSIVHNKEYNEAWLSIPDINTTIVWNYIKNSFYYFQFYKVPSCLVSCRNSVGKRITKMGTRDGCLAFCDSGTADHTTPITATYRKGWLDMKRHGIGRLMEVDYELPAGKTITANFYVNMEKDVFRTEALTGATPTSTDAEIRRIIGDKVELGLRARWVSVEFVNAEDCGGDCKLNEAVMFVRPDAIKRKVNAN
jgi:hypothetical protein